MREVTNMKFKHTYKFKDGTKETVIFNTERSSYMNIIENTRKSMEQGKDFNIKCMWFEPVNKPYERTRIDF
jgi:hypothetical protein